MINRIAFFALILITIWVAASAIRIEILNAQAEHYLPRHDEDGKWRISRENTVKDQLRELVSTVGLLQYGFAPLVIGLASFHLTRKETRIHRWLAICCGIVGLVALSLALYRSYFSSLG